MAHDEGSTDRRLYAGDATLVIEIVSPDSSFRTDTVGKKAAYAEEYRLSEGRYHLVCLHTRRLSLDVPIPIDAPFDTLTAG